MNDLVIALFIDLHGGITSAILFVQMRAVPIDGEKIIQIHSYTTVLLMPQLRTLKLCLRK